MVLNDLVARIQGHNDLLLQSFDDFVACDNDVETCDNTIKNLKIKCWRNEYLELQNKIPAESDNEDKLSEEKEASSSTDKCSKSSLASVRATLKCVGHKTFSIVRDAAHHLALLYEIEKGLCEMSMSSLRQKYISDFFNKSD